MSSFHQTQRLRRTTIALALLPSGICCGVCLAGNLPDPACCIVTNELQNIGACVSGPGVLSRPESCGEVGRCYHAEGADVAVRGDPLLSDRTADPVPARAICSSNQVAGLVQGYSLFGANIDLFSGFDYDQDGDLDLRDIADFLNTYAPAPKLVQSDAMLVAAQCCFSREGQGRVGTCLSGPNRKVPVGLCEEQGTCVMGFSAPIEPGDYFFGHCVPAPSFDTIASDVCEVLMGEFSEVAFECTASRASGITPFETLDADGDADFDLSDFAKFQNELGAE